MNLQYIKYRGIYIFNTPFPFTLGTVGKASNKIDYSKNSDTARNDEVIMLSNFLGIDKTSIITLNQVHGDSIIVFDNIGNKPIPDADGIITKTDKLCLVIRTADCVPVFAFDLKKNILGAVHSGWKGCRLNISGKLINRMKSAFQSKESDLHVFILPSIGPESYTVNMDVGSLFKNNIIIKNKKIYLDLWMNIYRCLTGEGIPESNIHMSGICTYKNNMDFFSYRYGDFGRNLNFGIIQNGSVSNKD